MILYCFFRLSVQSTQNGLRVTRRSCRKMLLSLAFANRLTADDADSFVSPPAANEWIGLLQTTGFCPEVCWKLMLIMQSPKEKLKNLAAIINSNIPAYEKAA